MRPGERGHDAELQRAEAEPEHQVDRQDRCDHLRGDVREQAPTTLEQDDGVRDARKRALGEPSFLRRRASARRSETRYMDRAPTALGLADATLRLTRAASPGGRSSRGP